MSPNITWWSRLLPMCCRMAHSFLFQSLQNFSSPIPCSGEFILYGIGKPKWEMVWENFVLCLLSTYLNNLQVWQKNKKIKKIKQNTNVCFSMCWWRSHYLADPTSFLYSQPHVLLLTLNFLTAWNKASWAVFQWDRQYTGHIIVGGKIGVP